MLPARRNTDLDPDDDRLRMIGDAANAAAAAHTFTEYNDGLAANTRLAKRGDLALFAEYLAAVGMPGRNAEQLQNDAGAWSGVTWGIVAAFVQWMLQRGAALATVNRALSTVRSYAKLAAQAGGLAIVEHVEGESPAEHLQRRAAANAAELALIRTVQGYGGKQGRRKDEKRTEAGTATRRGHKKAEAVAITDAQAKALKKHPDTAQGRRDALLMALLLDHGLRESELEHVTLAGFDLAAGTFTFHRPKVNLDQTHKMTPATARAMRAWIDAGECPAMGPILRSSRKGGELLDQAMSLSAIRARVRSLGSAVGVDNLSPHDCRHYWATKWGRKADRGEISLFRLQEAGGWASLAMPRKYVALAAIANEGMHEDGDD